MSCWEEVRFGQRFEEGQNVSEYLGKEHVSKREQPVQNTNVQCHLRVARCPVWLQGS